MNDGNVNNNNKTNSLYVWPVRGGAWEASPGVLFAELYHSYLRCRRNKRSTINALRFETNAEENLYILAEELASGAYQPSRSIRFVVDRPKLREIVAADFRDRVVHHYLVKRLERIFEPVFIHDSYACRTGKGVHAALQRTRTFIRQGTRNGTVPLFALHLDVKNFFMTIDKRILSRMVEDRLVKEARRAGEHGVRPMLTEGEMSDSGERRSPLPFIYRLARILIDHNPMNGRIDKGDRRMLERIPPHKTLLHTPFGKGLPVGNLTSQFFANVYLNELDQYCKHTLKCRYYVRYCDDFLILDNDPKRLEQIREDVRSFLAERLRLELNTRYAAITDVRNGIDFIGYIIRPDYVLVRRRSVNNLKNRLDKFERDEVRVDMYNDTPLFAIRQTEEAMDRLRGVVASYCGHFKWADTHRLRRSLFVHYPWLNALYRLDGKTMPRQRKVANPVKRKIKVTP
ncbi:MAG: hypothetical protein A2075_16110 [Geobacteraceae bacterium GWC2_58_44]|nr:MAG: hypothetical protein A2075_16110 [Geobacteraceae bacterium GWC2_58_44]HBG07860.1 reverse transcriptase [Geobacter sp.]